MFRVRNHGSARHASNAAFIRDKDMLLALVAHDLKNPFSILINATGFLAEHCGELPPEQLGTLLLGLKHQAEKSYALCDELLTWSKCRSGALLPFYEELALDGIAAETLEGQAGSAEARGVTLSRSGDEGLTVIADRRMLKAALRNLLANAIKFSPRGSRVELRLARSPGEIRIDVCDSGPGLTEAELALLFSPGVDASSIAAGGAAKGSGLGLILCREFMERIGGSVRANSVHGEGSTFSLAMPADRSLTSSRPPSSAAGGTV